MSPTAPLTVGDVALGAGRSAIIVPLTGATRDELQRERDALAGHPVDIVEWRIDRFHSCDPGEVAATARTLAGPHPLLATVRTTHEGGDAHLDADTYRELVETIIASGAVELVDVEYRREGADALIDRAREAGVVSVASFHDFTGTPPRETLVEHFRAMERLGADVLKIAVMPHSPADVLTLLEATREVHETVTDRPLIAIAMGDLGRVTRLAGSLVGSVATFGTVGADSAPGQAPARELRAALDLLEG